MIESSLRLLAVFLVLTIPSLAMAQDAAPEAIATQSADISRAAVIADEELGVIRFVIDGREVARVDSDGLHISGDVEYSGTIADVGPEGFSRTVDKGSEGPQ